MAPVRGVLLGLIVALHTSMAGAFKASDFRGWEKTAFAKRLRGQQTASLSVLPESVRLEGRVLQASVATEGQAGLLQLSLSLHGGGVVRVQLDEQPTGRRFRVPDVLQPEAEAAQAWDKPSLQRSSATLAGGGLSLTLQYRPLLLTLRRGKRTLATLNSRSLLAMELQRQRQEGDPEGWWEETFNGHTDSKPRGPQAISLDLSFPDAVHAYGLPQHATNLSLPVTSGGEGNYAEPYRLYNLDVFEYAVDTPFGLYGAIPLLWLLRPDSFLAAFWLNAAEMYVDVAKSRAGMDTQWLAESGVVDLFLLAGPTPQEVSKQYASLTGLPALPQHFSLGYHQCRWNYRDEADVREVNAKFDEHDIPYDVIWLDIEHTDGKRYFTWDAAAFPAPAKLQEDLAALGRKTVTIIDPHVKRDEGYYIYKEALALDIFVKDKSGNVFDGWCWPGSSSYLDLLNPAARTWWAAQFALDKYKGSTPHLYVWNDMNEPSVFNGPEITMHKDSLHAKQTEHRDLHNLNGMLFHEATAQGLVDRGRAVHGADGDRPFVLSRAFFAGSQCIGPIWTGDNAAKWEHLQISLPMVMSIGLAGLPFAGADVGGFFGDPDEELLVRWYQAGAYYPFFRGHAHLDAKRREPWLFGPEVTARIQRAIHRRYALLPYLYTTFQHASTTGEPILRPLFYEFPTHPATHALQHQFLLGSALLVAPVLHPGAETVDIYLPHATRWYDAVTGERPTVPSSRWLTLPVTLDSAPAYYRGGHIVPERRRVRRSSAAAARDPLTLVVALDAAGAAEGALYADDGRSFAFRRGAFAARRLAYRAGRLTNEAEHESPDFPYSDVEVEQILVLGLPDVKGWRVTEGSRVLEAGPGPLDVGVAGAPNTALRIRKPGLKAASSWTLVFKSGGSTS